MSECKQEKLVEVLDDNRTRMIDAYEKVNTLRDKLFGQELKDTEKGALSEPDGVFENAIRDRMLLVEINEVLDEILVRL